MLMKASRSKFCPGSHSEQPRNDSSSLDPERSEIGLAGTGKALFDFCGDVRGCESPP